MMFDILLNIVKLCFMVIVSNVQQYCVYKDIKIENHEDKLRTVA